MQRGAEEALNYLQILLYDSEIFSGGSEIFFDIQLPYRELELKSSPRLGRDEERVGF